ncbi:hypothetical protein [Roseibium aggregatum]|uniref:Uncharacterized protein n=1 Tax=Roseibium aggregatum TaxID=187304 RepID=A0A926P153_9HYPH|nr:hypothetical protein [Roseibium aggregatum]MBD1547518.1 hypothetical protein [Roseibium aggregatum]
MRKIHIFLSLSFFILSTNPSFSFTEDVRKAVHKILSNYGYVLIEFSPHGKTADITPGSFIYRQNYDPTQKNFSSSQFGSLCTPKYSTFRINGAFQSKYINQGLFQEVPTHFKYTGNKLKYILQRAGLYYLSQTAITMEIIINPQIAYYLKPQEYIDITKKLGKTCSDNISNNSKNHNAFLVKSSVLFSIDYEFEFGRNTKRNTRVKIDRELKNVFNITEVENIGNYGKKASGIPRVYGVLLEELEN